MCFCLEFFAVTVTGPLACLFARSLAPLTHSLAPHYLLRLRAALRSLAYSLAPFVHSLARGTVNDEMAIYSVFFPVFDHSAHYNCNEWLSLT